jgi:hypothetical protein
VNLREQGGSIKLILKELLDQIFQTNGQAGCSWYTDSGELKPEMKKRVNNPYLWAHLTD